MNLKPSRWGFRTRLTALTTAVFVLAGAGLLVVQYLLVQQLFTVAIAAFVFNCTADDADVVSVEVTTDGDVTSGCADAMSGGAGGKLVTGPADGDVLVEQGSVLSRDVLSGLLGWSVVTLVVFAAVAFLVASWLSKRSFRRIASITGAAKQLSQHDLHRRLDLPGPEDEIKELGDTIDDMLDRLEHAFTAQKRFVANASHELRTPLTTTRTALEIPLTQGKVPDHLRPAIEKAIAANEYSEKLIAALLVLARGTDPVFGRVDVAALVSRTIDAHREEATSRGIRVNLDAGLDAGAAEIAGDELLLERAVGNLIENAIVHNEDAGAVNVTVAVRDAAVVVEVENSGELYDAGEATALVEPFNRGKRSRLANDGDRGGIGLGLGLVESIAERHGGTLTLRPRAGGGLVATLVLG